jgi:hypothetical protein
MTGVGHSRPIDTRSRHVRFTSNSVKYWHRSETPLCAISGREQMQQTVCAISYLLDHLVGAGEQRRRHFEAERFCGCEINNEIELSWLLDWDVTRLRPA